MINPYDPAWGNTLADPANGTVANLLDKSVVDAQDEKYLLIARFIQSSKVT